MIQFREVDGPVLALTDCLAPMLVLTPDTAPCPICGTHATDAHAPGSDGPMIGQLTDGVLYGNGVLDPCGHEIGSITIDKFASEVAS